MRQAAIETGVASAGAILSVFGLVHALSFKRDSAYLPIAVTGLLTLLLLVWAARSALALRHQSGRSLTFSPDHVRRFFILLATSIVMIVVAPWFGFATTFLLFVPLSGRLLGYRNGKWLMVTSITFSLLIYLIFKVMLDRPLPPEMALRFFTGT